MNDIRGIKLIIAALVCMAAGSSCRVQKINTIITKVEVTRIERTLSSDAMEGRKAFTPGIEKAAAFIAAEMKKAGLQPLPKAVDFMQRFTMLKPVVTAALVMVNEEVATRENVVCISANEIIAFNEQSGYKLVTIKAGSDFLQIAKPYISAKENVLILVDTSFAAGLKSLQRLVGSPRFIQSNNVVFVLASEMNATTYSVHIQQQLTEQTLANVAGILPGKSRPDEYLIFSGHYDHLGYGKPDSRSDSLYNGANDDASGTTAVLMLARYFRKLHNNERTLVFVAFTAEELGGFGSRYFSDRMDAAKVAAMFNIELIGTESKWGTNSAYITGYDQTDLGKLLEKNLTKTRFRFYADPYLQQKLFYRSDNATLARLGVPAHTISTSKMDNELHYHKASDEISTLDMKNMTEIIKSIAISAKSIIAGKDTPTRINTTQLR